ncbi:MAG: hypothetical protein ACOH5I_20640 [Oligoflexus sp.]
MKKLGQQECASCGEMKRCRHREFSPHAWAILLHWEEIDSSMIDQPICNQCYEELRELLIDRSSEIEHVIAQGLVDQEQAVIAQTLSSRVRIADQMVG